MNFIQGRDQGWFGSCVWYCQQLEYVKIKLRQLGPINGIVDYSDFKPSKFELRNLSWFEIRCQIRTLIKERWQSDWFGPFFWLSRLLFDQFLSKIVLFSKNTIKRSKMVPVMSIKISELTKSIDFSISFNHLWLISNIFNFFRSKLNGLI